MIRATRNVQNRYEVCIYDKQRRTREREIGVCVSLLLKKKKVFLCVKASFRETSKKKTNEEEIELEENKQLEFDLERKPRTLYERRKNKTLIWKQTTILI